VNFFNLYPGDYLRDTTRLSLIEHGAYLRLMLAYYGEEQPLPANPDELYTIVCAVTRVDQAAVRKVADRYFPVGDDGLRHNARADEEISKGQHRSETARKNGKRGGSPLKKAGYNEPGFLYAVQRVKGGPIKVGITKNPPGRFSELSRKVGKIKELLTVQVNDMGAAEAAVHAYFAEKIDGEWIDASEDEILLRIRAQQGAQPGITESADPGAQWGAGRGAQPGVGVGARASLSRQELPYEAAVG